MKSITRLFHRGEEHKIKKKQAAKHVTEHQLRSRVHQLEKKVSAMITSLNRIDNNRSSGVTVEDEKLVSKLTATSLKLSQAKKHLLLVEGEKKVVAAPKTAIDMTSGQSDVAAVEQRHQSWFGWLMERFVQGLKEDLTDMVVDGLIDSALGLSDVTSGPRRMHSCQVSAARRVR